MNNLGARRYWTDLQNEKRNPEAENAEKPPADGSGEEKPAEENPTEPEVPETTQGGLWLFNVLQNAIPKNSFNALLKTGSKDPAFKNALLKKL